MKTNPKRLLNGIIPPMVTPLKDFDTLDTGGTEKLIEHILAGGVHGLFILGTTGEAPNLSARLQNELISRVCEQVSGRVPIFVGITDTSFERSLLLAEHSYNCGASAVVVAPPYYLPVGQSEFVEYMERLVERLPLPAVLYNMPSCTKLMISTQSVVRLADVPGIIGIKDSSGDMCYFHKLKYSLIGKDFNILIGPEELLAESMLLGGCGGVSGGANMFPKLYVDLYNEAKSGNWSGVQRLHKIIIAISATIYSTGSYSSSVVKGIKCALNLMQICEDYMAEPFYKFKEPKRAVLTKHLAKLLKDYDEKICNKEQTLCVA